LQRPGREENLPLLLDPLQGYFFSRQLYKRKMTAVVFYEKGREKHPLLSVFDAGGKIFPLYPAGGSTVKRSQAASS